LPFWAFPFFVYARQTEGQSRVALDRSPGVDLVHIQGWISHDKVGLGHAYSVDYLAIIIHLDPAVVHY
jgi:hypothetical protein